MLPRPAASIFCSVSSFRSDVRHFFVLELVRPSGPWCFPVRQRGYFLFSKVSEATLDALFGGVRPSGPWCFPVRQRRFSVLFLVSEATLDTFLVGFSD